MSIEIFKFIPVKTKTLIYNVIKTWPYNIYFDIRYFSVSIAVSNFLYYVSKDFNKLHHLYENSIQRRHNSIIKYLEHKYMYLINKYEFYNNNININETEDTPIWIFWWQGIENAPSIVKRCYESVIANAGNHKVILLSNSNIKDYISLPDHIMEKVKNNTLSLQHFSDIIRFNLLLRYGGLWLDATIYCTQKIPEHVFKYQFFTHKSESKKCEYVSEYRWAGFVMGGRKNSIIFDFIYEFLIEYWKTNKHIIDYFLLDYIIAIGYKKIPAIKSSIESVAFNNPNLHLLAGKLNDIFHQDLYDKICCTDTYMFKLTWKEEFYNYTEDGYDTNFLHIMNNKYQTES